MHVNSGAGGTNLLKELLDVILFGEWTTITVVFVKSKTCLNTAKCKLTAQKEPVLSTEINKAGNRSIK